MSRTPRTSARSHAFVACSALEVLNSETCIAHDLPEQASTEIALAVHRDGDPSAIGMVKDRVTAALPDAQEPFSLEGSNDLVCCDDWKPRAQTATFTWETATSS